MYITRVRLSNIRGFSGSRTVELDFTRPDGTHAGWTVLAGRNGSGKTTMLRAMALTVAGPEVARNLMPERGKWMGGDKDDPRVMLGIGAEPEDVWQLPREVGLAGPPLSEPEIDLGLRWVPLETAQRFGWRDSGLQRRLTPDKFSSISFEFADRRQRMYPSVGPWNLNRMGWFCAGYGAFRRLPGAAAERLGRSSPRLEDRMASLFHEDVPLTEGVTWLVDLHLQALEGHTEAGALKDLALRILADGLLPDDYELSKVNSAGLWVVSRGREFLLLEMSDGYRTVAALVIDILRQMFAAYGELPHYLDDEGHTVVTAPGVVMIDEAEAHLHISWQKRIGWWLKTHFPRVQFIVTTHSPYICQDADPGGLIRLPGPDEQAKPEVVSEDLWERVVYGSGDDAVVSELFGVDSTFSNRAQRLRAELVSLESKVIRDIATAAEILRYRELKDRLTSSAKTRSMEIGAGLLDPGAADE
jgi:hypothetical protein